MQAARFEAVFYEFRNAMSDAEERARCNSPDDNAVEWKEHYDRNYQPYDSQRPVKVPTLALSMQVATELDLLIVAVRNLLRAQARLPERLRTTMTDEDALELLRNVTEHWDEVGGRSAEKLATEHPDVSVDGIMFTNKEIWIGGKVPLSRIRAWLARAHQDFVVALESAGVIAPGDFASLVEGDDSLAWPPDRHRYRYWSLPIVDEKDWPTKEMPAELARLFRERFRRLRERDVAD